MSSKCLLEGWRTLWLSSMTSRYIWVCIMKEKSKTFSKFKEFKKTVERHINMKIQCLHTYNRREYLSNDFTIYLKKNKIIMQLTCDNTSHPNRVVERQNYHLAETFQSMLHAKNVLGSFWSECMRTTVYVINRLPRPKLGFKSPHELLWKVKPRARHVKVFDYVCYVSMLNHLWSKFEKKVIQCIFVGYDDAQKGWKVLWFNHGKVPYLEKCGVWLIFLHGGQQRRLSY